VIETSLQAPRGGGKGEGPGNKEKISYLASGIKTAFTYSMRTRTELAVEQCSENPTLNSDPTYDGY
jgi:hypothetical protein